MPERELAAREEAMGPAPRGAGGGSRWRAVGEVLRLTWRKWRDDGAVRQGAALAYYALFCAVPLGVVLHRAGTRLLGPEAFDAFLESQLGIVLPAALVGTTRDLVTGSSTSGPVLALLFGLYAGMRGLLHLQSTLNELWGVRAVRGPGPVEMVRRKLWAFASAGGTAVLLLGALLADRLLEQATLRHAPLHPGVGWLTDSATNLVLLTVLLLVVWRTLADVEISWVNALLGASVTALGLVAGREAIAAYLATSGRPDAFGAAGPVVALMLYAYYAAQVLLGGVCFTWVVAERRGDPILPNRRATRVVRVRVDDGG